MRILVIDDQPAVAAILAEALGAEGNEVSIAHSGVEGLEAIAQNPPDAVFLDIVMPEMDGVEVLRRIRARHPSLPVVVISGWGTPEQIEEARRLGVTDVIPKPEPLKNLADALRRLRSR